VRLALFDLDHTLIPFDSGLAWTRFLVAHGGVLPAGFDEHYLDHCRRYAAGTLSIEALHRLAVAPLGPYPRSDLAGWVDHFEREMAGQIPPASLDLVDRHRGAGDLCVLVTATTRFIAEPFGRLFGIAHVLATEAATVDCRPDSVMTGEIDGMPCHGRHKLERVTQWLDASGMRLADFEQSWFYSDACGDLPLLEAVSHPVAMHPEPRLLAHALRRGWRIVKALRDG
jgi:HAD superfamily hydrolase (TIGR01490 family)